MRDGALYVTLYDNISLISLDDQDVLIRVKADEVVLRVGERFKGSMYSIVVYGGFVGLIMNPAIAIIK